MKRRHDRSNEAARAGAPRKTGGVRGKAPAAVRWAAFFLFITVIFAVAFYDVLGALGSDMIGKGVYIGPVDSSGKTSEGAAAELKDFLENYRLTFMVGTQSETVGPFVAAQSAIVGFRPETAIEDAFRIGRNGNAALALIERLGAAVFGAEVSVPYTLDETALVEALRERFSPMVGRAENARLEITVDDNDGVEVTIVPGKEGVFFDTDSLLDETRDRLHRLSPDAVSVAIVEEEPEVSADELEPLVAAAKAAMDRAPRTVTIKGETWEITAEQLADWVVPAQEGGSWTVALDADKMRAVLETYAATVAVAPQDAIFKEENGRVIEFSPGINGEKLDLDASMALLNTAFLTDDDAGSGSIGLPITVAEPAITTEASNPYGIKEIVGLGETNFKGSPANRRHNIATGAASLQGILIKPGEEFSLLAALGEIDGEHGYLQELVIKQNETKPEFGGGLCQIGTTTFRTVLDAGLPVTARQNHSYRVVYYERDGDGNYMGPGVDATIYDPWPDFKFINDTGHHILFQTVIDGTRLTFIFWGVRDGRQVERSEVSVWNITPPPEKKEIRTTNIPAGTTKCTESPHSGATTKFTYTVNYASGEEKEQEFLSVYRPWGEVCMIGVTPEELAAWEAEQAAKEAGEAGEGAPFDAAQGREAGEGIEGIVG